MFSYVDVLLSDSHGVCQIIWVIYLGGVAYNYYDYKGLVRSMYVL